MLRLVPLRHDHPVIGKLETALVLGERAGSEGQLHDGRSNRLNRVDRFNRGRDVVGGGQRVDGLGGIGVAFVGVDIAYRFDAVCRFQPEVQTIGTVDGRVQEVEVPERDALADGDGFAVVSSLDLVPMRAPGV